MPQYVAGLAEECRETKQRNEAPHDQIKKKPVCPRLLGKHVTMVFQKSLTLNRSLTCAQELNEGASPQVLPGVDAVRPAPPAAAGGPRGDKGPERSCR